MPIPVELTPPPARSRGALLDAAQRIPSTAYGARNGQNRWPIEGVTWNPWVFTLPDAEEAQCDTIYDKQPDDLEGPVEQPAFLLWRSLQCSRLSAVYELLDARNRYSLETLESAAFAAELESGAASGGLGLIGNGTYTPMVVTSSPSGLRSVIAELEEYLADTLNGATGMIHLTAHLLELAVTDELVAWDGQVYRTHTGHVVTGDAGFSGEVAPEGESAPATGEAWVYATSTVWFDDTEVKGSASFGADPGDFDFSRNVDRPLSERSGIVLFDPAVLAVGLVDVDASASAGSGGSSSTYTQTAAAVGAIAAASTFNGVHLYNSHASDAVLIYIRHGDQATDTPFIPVAIAAGQSVNWFDPNGEYVGADGLYVTDESAGSADISDLVGYIVTS